MLTRFAKAALINVVTLLTAQAAFAQITINLDVLTEDFISKDAITSTPANEKKVSPAATVKQPDIQQKKSSAVKAKPATKPVVKKTPAPKKPAKPSFQKTAKQPVKKYQIKETTKKDEHDLLKPRANPVPNVKVLASDDNTKLTEAKTDDTIEIIPPKPIEPKISKHFLEQEQLKKQETEQAEEENVAVEKNTHSDLPQTSLPVKDSFLTLKPDNGTTHPKPKMLLSSFKQEKAQKQTPRPKPVQFSVFYVSGKLTPSERSAILAKEIPTDSATKKALDQKKELLHIFVFENKSSTLTDEMQTALDSTAEMMKKNRNKRLLLYSYSAADPSDPGKERQYALRRALMIRSYLTQKGIRSLRIEMRSFGQKGAGDKMPDRTDILIEDK